MTTPAFITPPRNVPQSLADAMITWGDPKLVADLNKAYQSGALSTLASIFGNETNETRRALPYTRITDELRAALLEKLRAGQLVAAGFLDGAAPNAPRSVVLAERWDTLTPNFDVSTAAGSGIRLTGLLVSEPGVNEGELSDYDPSAEAASKDAVLVVLRSAREITFAGQSVQLSTRVFDLIELLAEAAAADGRIVSHQEIEDRLWSSGTIPVDGVNDTIRELRIKLRERSINLKITNRKGHGFQLELRRGAVGFR